MIRLKQITFLYLVSCTIQDLSLSTPEPNKVLHLKYLEKSNTRNVYLMLWTNTKLTRAWMHFLYLYLGCITQIILSYLLRLLQFLELLLLTLTFSHRAFPSQGGQASFSQFSELLWRALGGIYLKTEHRTIHITVV